MFNFLYVASVMHILIAGESTTHSIAYHNVHGNACIRTLSSYHGI